MIFNQFSQTENKQNASIRFRSISNDVHQDEKISTTIDDLSHLTNESWKSQRSFILHKEKHSLSNADCIDWTIAAGQRSAQLDAIDFLQDCFEHGQTHLLIDLLHDIAREMNTNDSSLPHGMNNNNHLQFTPTLHRNFQLSNIKEKKSKKEKTNGKDKQNSDDDKAKNNENKKESSEEEMATKKAKNKSQKSKKAQESISDSEIPDESNVSATPQPSTQWRSPKSVNYSPIQSTPYPTFSMPVPQPGDLSMGGLISPNSSPIYVSQGTNVAHLGHVQQQLQTDSGSTPYYKAATTPTMSVQQQLQTLSQMARNGDEVLITLNVNAVNPKQAMTQSYYQQPYQNNPSLMPSIPPVESTFPRNVEIIAKGFARIQSGELPVPPPPRLPVPQGYSPQSNTYHTASPSTLPPFSVQSSTFAPRYSGPCQSSNGPPMAPIGPPIQPVLVPPTKVTTDGFSRPNHTAIYTADIRNPSHPIRQPMPIQSGKCDKLCQSSLNQPDFRGRPSPGVLINPYYPNLSSSSRNFSAQAKKQSSRRHQRHDPPINRTYSSLY